MTKTKHEWRAADRLTDEEIHASAMSEPDAQSLTLERLARIEPPNISTTVQNNLQAAPEARWLDEARHKSM